jgi:hypothetical protein
MNNEHIQVVEINGVKMEVDTRQARVIHDNIRIGSTVKLLEKSTYGTPEIYQGVVVGFAPFEELPTLTICYLKASYSDAELKFAHVNGKSGEKWSIVPCMDDELPIHREDMLKRFSRQVERKHEEIREIEQKREYFLRHFDKFFVSEEVETA